VYQKPPGPRHRAVLEPEAFFSAEVTLAWASGIAGAIGSSLGVGPNLVVQIADEAAVVAWVISWLRVISSDVPDTLTRLILRGGMLADIAVCSRLLGDDRSKAVRVVWPPATSKIWFPTSKSGQSHGGCEHRHKDNGHHNNTNASQALPPSEPRAVL
jgi:hypothetical protein